VGHGKLVQCDEIWCFVGAKHKNATPQQKADEWGDVWTWTAIDAEPCPDIGGLKAISNASGPIHPSPRRLEKTLPFAPTYSRRMSN